MRVITVANQKGGVAKSVTAASLIAGAASKGIPVLGIDLDAQNSLSYTMGADTSRPGIFELMTRRAPTKDVIQHTAHGDIIPGGLPLATIDGRTSSRLLQKTIGIIKGYELVIVDCCPGLGALMMNGLTAAKELLIPLQADILSLEGLNQLYTTIQHVRDDLNPALAVCGVVITRYNGRSVISRDMMENIRDRCHELHLPFIETPIREGVAVREAQAVQESIFDYAPRSKPAQDYKALLDAINI